MNKRLYSLQPASNLSYGKIGIGVTNPLQNDYSKIDVAGRI